MVLSFLTTLRIGLSVNRFSVPPHTTVPAAALTAKGMGTLIEEELLTLAYSSTSGGRPPNATYDHIRFTQDAVMLAHLTPSSNMKSPDGFTVNTKVTTDDIYGNSPTTNSPTTSGNPQCGSILDNVFFEGRNVDWPTKALQFLTNR